ncbi:MAG: FAD:protein FMN transferase, partial [Bdellovibrionales bacterium]|nr:FAD:protein FMN transferase [Bdellovibrionales bacterium]
SIQPLWSYLYYLEPEQKPDPKHIRELLDVVDYRAIDISSSKVALRRAGMQITLNGIAQGFITDRVTELFRSRGLQHALIQLGETFALGRHSPQRPWQVGIEDLTGRIVARESLENMALATSAGAGTPFSAGANAHHLVDACSGEPEQRYRSLSVIASNATDADGLSTALSFLDTDRQQSILRQYPGAKIASIL